jgi:hypothetical protein
MILQALIFFAAFSIEILGSLISVIGLSALFGSNPIIIALAISLDVGKIANVSLLYKYWKQLPNMMRAYGLIAAIITMTITSAGSAGYLSGEFQKAILGTQTGSAQVEILKQQQAKYEDRKKQIDEQIASLPQKTSVTQRIRMMNAFKTEQQDLQQKINEIDAKLPELQVQQLNTEAHAGPILYVAKAFNITVEEAVKYVILLIIFVFDPFAIFLIVSGNFLSEVRKKFKSQQTEVVADEPAPSPESAPEPFIEPEKVLMQPVLEEESVEPIVHENEDEPQELEPEPEPESVQVQNPTPDVELPKQEVVQQELSEVVDNSKEKSREVITLSSLGLVKPDPKTIVDTGALSPAVRPDIYRN